MKCVHGHGEMLVRHVFDVEVDHCAECSGMWLDPGELARSAHASPSYEEALRERLTVGVPNPSALCPRCLLPLSRAHAQGVPLLTCAECSGLWLEAASYEQLEARAKGKWEAATVHGTDVVPDEADGRSAWRTLNWAAEGVNLLGYVLFALWDD